MSGSTSKPEAVRVVEAGRRLGDDERLDGVPVAEAVEVVEEDAGFLRRPKAWRSALGFFREEQKRVMEDNPSWPELPMYAALETKFDQPGSVKDQDAARAEAWEQLSSEAKQPYVDASSADKEVYKRELAEFERV